MYVAPHGSPEGALRNARVRAILQDHLGAMWIGTFEGGLHRLQPRTGEVTSFRRNVNDPRSLSSDRVRAVMEDDAHRLWVATSDGLNLFDRATQSFVRYRRDADSPH